MAQLVFSLTTAVLLVLMLKAGVELTAGRRRRVPWAAVALSVLGVAGVIVQLSWSGALPALDDDPARSGWWRPVTAVFLQNGGFAGAAWNLVTLAAIAALAHWYWSGPLALGLFTAGALGPGLIDVLVGATEGRGDPRNFVGSSGATYFLAATLAAALLWETGSARLRLLAAGAPALGLAMWFGQANGHGLVAVYGFVLGLLLAPVVRRVRAARRAKADRLERCRSNRCIRGSNHCCHGSASRFSTSGVSSTRSPGTGTTPMSAGR